jgi:L-asparaginase
MPKILLVHTGGTLMMRAGESQAALEPAAYIQDLHAALPVLRDLAEFDTHILWNLDSADLQPSHWVELAGFLHGRIESYDGAVVVLGTDTMAYTASALAFLLPDLDRPVVCTGAQRPLFDVRTDARTNLVDACHIATLAVPEVGIAFSSQFLRGCRTTKMDSWSMTAFESPLCRPLVELGLGVYIAPHVLAPRPVGGFDPRIDPEVIAVRVTPGLPPQGLLCALESGVHGLVLEAFGVGNVPHLDRSLIPVVREAATRDVPVVLVSQCPHGGVDLHRYAGSAEAAAAGAISGGDMTTEATVAKLMVLLGRAPAGHHRDHVANGFRRGLLGEMSADLPFA